MNLYLDRHIKTGAEVVLDGSQVLNLEDSVRGCQIEAGDAIFLGAFDAEEVQVHLLPVGVRHSQTTDDFDHDWQGELTGTGCRNSESLSDELAGMVAFLDLTEQTS